MSDAANSSSPGRRLAAFVFGYRADTLWPPEWRLVPPAALALALAAVFGTALWASPKSPAPTDGNVRITARLDEFTRSRDPKTLNSIPAFLHLPGELGAIGAEPVDDAGVPLDSSPEARAIATVDEIELSKGFCTPTVALLIRQRFPGVYDELSDAELEKRALARYPEYKDRVCVLPAWIGAAPNQIVKYELEPVAVAANYVAALLWAVVLTALFGFTTVNLYYRLVVPLVASSA